MRRVVYMKCFGGVFIQCVTISSNRVEIALIQSKPFVQTLWRLNWIGIHVEKHTNDIDKEK